jgi:dienelactone hydrolase
MIRYSFSINLLLEKIMKLLILLTLVTSLSVSCGHMKKEKSLKETYSPVVSFVEGEKTYSAKVQLPTTKFESKIPLVVIVHEWWGRTPYIEERGQMLNKEGYATLIVDLFGNGQTVGTPSEAQALATPFYQDAQLGISKLKHYIELAKNDPHVDASRIYVIGFCFGGTQALNLARSGMDVKGVVSFHGGLKAGINAKEIKAEVLALNGLADPMVPAKERAAFEKEMKSVKAKYKVVNYKNATHAFTNPGATAIGKKYNIPIAYNQKADKASWNELLKFLKH